MSVGEPTQERRNVPAVRAWEAALGVGVEFVRQTPQRRHHRTRVQRHLACVGQYAGQQLRDLGERLAVHGLSELNVYPGLVTAFARRADIGGRPNVEQFPGRTAAHPEHRVHDRCVGHAESVQQDRHRVHHHRRVVGDNLQCGAESRRIVGCIHCDAGVADRPAPAEPVMRGHQPRPHQEARPPCRRASSPTNRRRARRCGPRYVTKYACVSRAMASWLSASPCGPAAPEPGSAGLPAAPGFTDMPRSSPVPADRPSLDVAAGPKTTAAPWSADRH